MSQCLLHLKLGLSLQSMPTLPFLKYRCQMRNKDALKKAFTSALVLDQGLSKTKGISNGSTHSIHPMFTDQTETQNFDI